jgi:hypothetical protein
MQIHFNILFVCNVYIVFKALKNASNAKPNDRFPENGICKLARINNLDENEKRCVQKAFASNGKLYVNDIAVICVFIFVLFFFLHQTSRL